MKSINVFYPFSPIVSLVQKLRLDTEEKLQQVEGKLLRATAAKERLGFVNSALLTRLKMATNTLDSILMPSDSHFGSQLPQSESMRSVLCPAFEQSSNARGSSLVSTNPRRARTDYVFEDTSALPRPLESYAHSASVSHEDILPHLPQCKQKHTSTPFSGDLSGFSTDDRSSGVSFSDLSRVRDAVECHRRTTEASMGALRAETAWFLLYLSLIHI